MPQSIANSQREMGDVVGLDAPDDGSYRLLFDSFPEPAWVFDSETLRFLDVNRAAVLRYGYSRGEFLSMTVDEIRPPEEVPRLLEYLRERVGQTPVLKTAGWHHRSKDDVFEVESSVSQVVFEGRPAVLVVTRDVKAQRQAEQELRRAEEAFRALFDDAPVPYHEIDKSGTIVRVNRAECELLGMQASDMIGRPVWDMVSPDQRDVSQASVQRKLREGKLRPPYERKYLGRDGVEHILMNHERLIVSPDGEVIGIRTAMLDITESKAAERANAELAAIVESAETAIITRDLNGKVLSWNAGAERIYGYSAAEMIGGDLSIAIPADRRAETDAVNAKVRSGNRVGHLETVRVTKSGARVDVLMTVSPIRDRWGMVVGTAYLVWDTSELRRLQKQLAQAQKLESVGQLAAGIAHEINTPIQYVGDNAEFLAGAFRDLSRFVLPNAEIVRALRDGPDPALADSLDHILREVDVDYLCQEIPNAIGQLSEGVQQVARIVRAMKEFSHPGSAEKVMLDINRAIESTILVSKNEWKYVAELTTDFDPDLPSVPCLAGELNQVMLNLIVNAAHAISDVVKDSGRKGAIRIATRHNGNWAEIRVSDTGTGIPEAIQSKVFDPFFTTKEVGKGTGQGLSIAHSVIVKKHAGALSFETWAGSGTTFLIQLPLRLPEGT